MNNIRLERLFIPRSKRTKPGVEAMAAASDRRGPFLLRLARALLVLNAVIWVLLAVFSLARMSRGVMAGTIALWIIGALMFANAAGMLWLGLGLGVKPRVYFLPAVVFLLLNVLLTITDQFGLLDLLTLLIDLAILVLLISARIVERRGPKRYGMR